MFSWRPFSHTPASVGKERVMTEKIHIGTETGTVIFPSSQTGGIKIR